MLSYWHTVSEGFPINGQTSPLQQHFTSISQDEIKEAVHTLLLHAGIACLTKSRQRCGSQKSSANEWSRLWENTGQSCKKKTSRNRMKFMKLARPDIYQIYHVYQIYQIYQIALNVRTSLKQNSQPLLLLLVLKPREVGIQPRRNSVSTSTTGYIHLCLLRRSCRRRHRACLARDL